MFQQTKETRSCHHGYMAKPFCMGRTDPKLHTVYFQLSESLCILLCENILPGYLPQHFSVIAIPSSGCQFRAVLLYAAK